MSTDTEEHRPSPRGMVIAAFAAIYLIWGSTYLAIRFAVETIPPFLLGGVRFLVAGGVLYFWLRLGGVPRPSRAHWLNAVIVGGLLLGVGNGAVNWAEQKVSSSLTALLIAITPLWFALLDWLRPGGTRPHLQTLLGIAVGFVGVAMLVGGPEALRRNGVHPAGALVLMIASVSWAAGSLYARYTPKPQSALMAGATQMLAGGALLAVTGVASGELPRVNPAAISAASAWSLVYLTVIGSLVGFTAFSWLLKVSTPARISTYAYVNPVIAVFLGWALGGETVTPRILLAAAVIVLGVVVITTKKAPAIGSNEKDGVAAPNGSTNVSNLVKEA